VIQILRFIAGFFTFLVLAAGCGIANADEVGEVEEIPTASQAEVAEMISEQYEKYYDERQEEIAIEFAGAYHDAKVIEYALIVYDNEMKRIEAERAAAAAAAAEAAAAQQVTTYSSGGSSAPVYSSGGGGNLASIRACESGGNYATNTGNGYYGAYQFDQQTWNSVGGTGNPANASPATQDAMANALIAQRGTSPWPNCG